MARKRRGTTEDAAAVPGQRSEPALPPDAGRDDLESDASTGQAPEVSPAPETPEAERTVPDMERPSPEPEQREPAPPPDHKIRHTRLSGTWVSVIASAIVLLLLLIFILENQHSVNVSYFGGHGNLPLGVALLLAAVAGILLTALAGSARIMQLRTTARKHRRAHHRAAKTGAREARAEAKAAAKARR